MEFEAVRIEGHLEVLALHRMLMEYKFEDIASEFAGSPFIAAIQNRLTDALEAADAGSAWRNWRKAETHTDRVESIRLYLAGAGGWWQHLDHEQRAEHVRGLLAPLQPSDELVTELTAIEGAPEGL